MLSIVATPFASDVVDLWAVHVAVLGMLIAASVRFAGEIDDELFSGVRGRQAV